jgi:hypothetical protein
MSTSWQYWQRNLRTIARVHSDFPNARYYSLKKSICSGIKKCSFLPSELLQTVAPYAVPWVETLVQGNLTAMYSCAPVSADSVSMVSVIWSLPRPKK